MGFSTFFAALRMNIILGLVKISLTAVAFKGFKLICNKLLSLYVLV